MLTTALFSWGTPPWCNSAPRVGTSKIYQPFSFLHAVGAYAAGTPNCMFESTV